MLRLKEFLPFRLTRLAETMSMHTETLPRDHTGISRPEWQVLASLVELGPSTASTLARHGSLHKTRVSRAVAALVERRWVQREGDPADRRAELLSLTAAGHSAYHDVALRLIEREAAVLSRIDPVQRDEIDRALLALERALGLVASSR